MAELEREFVQRALKRSGGKVADAAKLIGVSRKGLFLKRKRWNMLDGGSREGLEPKK
jgi:DNA-binding NtrC family response regulator